MAVLAHAQSGPVDLAGLAFVGAFVAGAVFWVVRSNRRLDATRVGRQAEAPVAAEYELESPVTDVSRTSPIAPVVVAVIVVILGAVGFYLYRAESHPAPAPAQGVVDDLCLAAEQVRTDSAVALATFNGRPHDALHALGIELRKVDPIAASRLATAKQQAEFAMKTSSGGASQLTAALAEATADAYRDLEPKRRISSCP